MIATSIFPKWPHCVQGIFPAWTSWGYCNVGFPTMVKAGIADAGGAEIQGLSTRGDSETLAPLYSSCPEATTPPRLSMPTHVRVVDAGDTSASSLEMKKLPAAN